MSIVNTEMIYEGKARPSKTFCLYSAVAVNGESLQTSLERIRSMSQGKEKGYLGGFSRNHPIRVHSDVSRVRPLKIISKISADISMRSRSTFSKLTPSVDRSVR